MMELIDEREKVGGTTRVFLEDRSHDTYILGTNKYGLASARFLQRRGHGISAFIDDRRANEIFNGVPVIAMNQVPVAKAVLNCIVEGRAIEARNNLLACQPASYCDYFALQMLHPDHLPEIDFMGSSHTILGDMDKYRKLFGQLADDESRQTLNNLLQFRYNRDVRWLESFTYRLSEQYFESFVRPGPSPILVDGGGFDGGTVLEFYRRFTDMRKVYYFEPNAASMETSKRNLAHVPNIEFHAKGLWHSPTTLHFDDSLGSASKISEQGGHSIDTTSIDIVVKEKVAMIKLDIEGAELNALDGAEKTILKHKPVLAVCVYHDQQDFWKVPEKVLSLVPEYQVYLRHYTQGVFETVMYFVLETTDVE